MSKSSAASNKLDKAVNEANLGYEQSHLPDFSKKHDNSKKSLAKKVRGGYKLVLAIAMLLFVVFGSYFLYSSLMSVNNNNDDDLACAQDEELIRGSAAAISKSNKDELQQFVYKAKNLSGNDRDQNCHYIYLNYFLLNGDYDNSKSTYDSYIAIYKEEYDKFKELGLRLMTNEQIMNAINFTSVQNKELIDNARIRGQNVGNQ